MGLGNHWQKETIRLRISEQMNNQTIICEVQDDDEETVEAEYKVELVEKLRDVQVMGGNVIPGTSGSLKLACFADARPEAIYQWTKDGKHMGEGAQVEVNEPGSYQCVACNSFGMIYSANHKVRDVVPPSVWVTTENNYVEEGDDVIMNCWFNYDGDDQDYHVRWSVINEVYDEQQIIFDYGVRGNTSLYENNFNEKYSTNDGRDLKIHNVQKDSNETYYCILITLDGIAYNSTNVYVSESNRTQEANTQTNNKSEHNEDQQSNPTTHMMTIENENDRNNQENMINEDQKDMDNNGYQESMSYTEDQIINSEGQQNMNITEYKNTNITKEENMNGSEEHQMDNKEKQINNNSNKQDEYKLNNEAKNNKTTQEQGNKYSQHEVKIENEEKNNSEYKQNFNETKDNYMNNRDNDYMEILEENKTNMKNQEQSMKENEVSAKDNLIIKEEYSLNNDEHSNKYNQENKPKEQQTVYKDDQDSMKNADFMKNQDKQKIENESRNKQEYNFRNTLQENSTDIKEEYNKDNNEDHTMIGKNNISISEHNEYMENSETEGDYSYYPNQKSLNNNVETTTSYTHTDFTTHAESNHSDESIEKEFNEDMYIEYVYDEDLYDEDSYDENSYDENSYDKNSYDENSYDEDSNDEDSNDEDLSDENSYDEDSNYEDSNDEDSNDENSYDEDSNDEDSNDQDSYDNVYTTEKMKQNEDENKNNSTVFNTSDVNSKTNTSKYDTVISMNKTTHIQQETESELSSDVVDEMYEIASEMYLQEENDSYVDENFQTTSADYLTNTEEFNLEENLTTIATETEKVSETEVAKLLMNKTNETSSCYFEEDEHDSYEMGTNNIDFEIYFMREKKTMKDFSFYNSDDEFSIMVKSVSLNGKKPVKMAKVEVYTFNLFQDGSCYLTEDAVVSRCEPQIIEANRAKRRLKGSIKLENEFTQCNFVIRVRVFTEDGNNYYQKLTWNDMKNSEQIVEKKSFFLIKPAETH